jgi:hypothetical protein
MDTCRFCWWNSHKLAWSPWDLILRKLMSKNNVRGPTRQWEYKGWTMQDVVSMLMLLKQWDLTSQKWLDQKNLISFVRCPLIIGMPASSCISLDLSLSLFSLLMGSVCFLSWNLYELVICRRIRFDYKERAWFLFAFFFFFFFVIVRKGWLNICQIYGPLFHFWFYF